MSMTIASRRSALGWLTADAAHGPLPALLVGLTVLTGVVDAVSIPLAVGCSVELVFVAAALTVTAVSGSALSAGGRDIVAAILAVGTGIQNAVARRLAVPDLTTTVLTMTLTGLAADPTGDGTHNATLSRRVLAVVAMLAGAVAGAVLVLNSSASAALAVGTALLTVVTVAAALTTQHAAAWRAQP
jgi:hypothetical protein